MGTFEKPVGDLGRFRHIGLGTAPYKDWVDVEFVLQEIEEELKAEVLATHLETQASVYRSYAEEATKIANILRGGGQRQSE
jgi:hypothetical protein